MRPTPAPSVVLLAAFVLGGLVGPALHRAEHAAEQARTRATHVAEGHHHHGAAVRHGAEAAAPCPEPVVVDLQCVLCAGVSVYLPAAPTALLAPARTTPSHAAPRAAAPTAPTGRFSIRGPPEAVA